MVFFRYEITYKNHVDVSNIWISLEIVSNDKHVQIDI